jgi:hypothetical protein
MKTNIPMSTKEIVKIKIGLCYLYLTEIEHSFKKFDYNLNKQRIPSLGLKFR